jgi:predicted nucleic acid-binding protein
LQVRSAAIGALINFNRERGGSVEIRSSAEISPDPEDDAFSACAAEGSADFIVTLNAKDFPQSRLKAKIIQPDPTHCRRGR